MPVEEEAIPEAAPAVDAEVKEAACDTEVNAEAAEDAEGAKADAEGAEAAEIEAAPAAAEPEKVAEEEPADEVEDTAPAEPAFEETVEEPEPDLEDIYLDMDLDSIDSARAAHSGRSEYRAYDTDLYDDINDTEEAEVTEAAEEAAESAEADGFELIDELEKAGEAEAADEEATEEPATDAAAEEPAEQEYEEAVDDLEEELFREMEESSPKKTGMTIAGPADTESEIEALKKRLAELMGNAPEETEVIEETVPEEAKADFRFSEVPSSGVDELFEGLSSEQEAEPSGGDEPAEDEDGDKGSMAGFTFDPIVTPEVDELFEGLTEEGRAAMEDGAGDEHLAASLDGASGESGAGPAVPDIVDLGEPAKEPEGGYSIDDLFKGLTPISEQTMDSAPVDLEAAARAARAEASPAAEAPVIELAPVGEIRIAAEPEAEAPSVSAEPAPAMSVDELLKGLSTEVGVAAPAAYAEADVKAETDTKTEIDAKPEAEAEAAVSAADDDDRASDALSLEELEINLFGEVPSAEVEAEETKKIDKFYTLYRKNEEFQRLLDEEYDRLRNGGREAAKPEAVSNAPKEEPSVVRIEDNKAYRQVEDETIYMPKELLEKEVAAEVAAIKAAPQEISAGTKAPVEITEFSASGGGAVDKKAAKAAAKAEKARLKEEKRRAKAGLPAESGADGSDDFGDVESGSGFLTVLAVIIAIILVMLLAVIIVLQVAPDSGAAAWINELIGRITQSIGLLEPFDGQTLL